jgi:DNA mismatch repair protein MutL
MSDIIKLLPDHIANQIAAGEVIQRPASVVKELMENAIDAGADLINLVIIDAGKTLIQVIDNGVGMSEQDAQMAFERHATSKISTAQELFSLHTKGFRGEALASVAAIAHVTLKTKNSEASLGTKVTIEGSRITSIEPDAIQKGSSLSIKNLFFNVPARRNFLKSDSVENKHIIEEFQRVALTHPEIAFTLHSNGNEMYNLDKTPVFRKRIVDIFGKSFNNKLVPIEEDTDLVKIKGFIVKPEFARKTSGEHYLFVNQRFFKDRYFHHAIKSAFENLIAKNLHPSYFLYFEVNPASIDVNVHPTKTEIKFEEDRSIYAIIRSSVRRALGLHNIAPTLDFEQEVSFETTHLQTEKIIQAPHIQVNPKYNPFQTTQRFTPTNADNRPKISPDKSNWEDFYKINEETKISPTSTIEFEENIKDEKTHKCIQIHKKFILSPTKNGIMWIDQNRAHIRVLYDELMQQFMTNPVASQQLLFPVEKEVNSNEKEFWESHKTQIERVGFSYEWNENLLNINGIPAVIEEGLIDNCIDDILHRLAYENIDSGEFAHAILFSLAKENAIKAGKTLNALEMEDILGKLFQSKEPSFTPDGKKIIHSQAIDELENNF